MFKHKVRMALFKHGTHSHVPSLGVLVLVTLVTSNFVTVQINVKIQNLIEIYPF